MWWHGELMTIAIVERLAKRIMGNHDDRRAPGATATTKEKPDDLRRKRKKKTEA